MVDEIKTLEVQRLKVENYMQRYCPIPSLAKKYSIVSNRKINRRQGT